MGFLANLAKAVGDGIKKVAEDMHENRINESWHELLACEELVHIAVVLMRERYFTENKLKNAHRTEIEQFFEE